MFRIVVLVSSLALPALAQNRPVPSSASRWTCYADGVINVGGPVGSIPQTVIGRGDTQEEAFSNAYSNCLSQGLRQCLVSYCFENADAD